MFEKEAEKWTIDYVCKDCSRYKECRSKEQCTCKECSKEKWQKGVEFGYNKANEELEEKIKVKKLEILELKSQIEKMKCLLNEIYSEYGFSELVKIRNNLPIEIQEVIKEIK